VASLSKNWFRDSRGLALLTNMSNPVMPPQWEETKGAAHAFGLEADSLDVRGQNDIGPALETALARRVDVLFVALDLVTQANLQLIVKLVARNRLPTIYASRQFVDAGGLMSYGSSYSQRYFRAATLVDKILKGAKPEIYRWSSQQRMS
jgi:putative tryptophan/tyrosine transport system substrate-binding protein